MGTPISSILSEIYLQYTKLHDILSSSGTEDYFRYIADIPVIYNDNYTDREEVQNSFNNITHGLNFTLEQEKDNKLNSLDLTITKIAGTKTGRHQILRKEEQYIRYRLGK